MLNKFDKFFDMGLVELCVVDEFRKLEVLPGAKWTPRFFLRDFRGFREVVQSSLEFLRTEKTGALAAARMVFDNNVPSIWDPRARPC